MAIARFKDLCLDAGDPARLGAFWAAVLDRSWKAQDNGDGLLTGRGAAAAGRRRRLARAADPEGNEFCAFTE